MNREHPAAQRPTADSSIKGSVRRIALMLLITFVVLFLLDPYLFIPFFLILWPLITGPYVFLERTIPKIQTNAESTAFLALILLILMVMTHHFLKWLYAGWKSKTTNATQAVRPWRWKWTALLTAAMLISLVTTMSLVAFAHQAGWLMKTDEPWIRNRYLSIQLQSTAAQVSLALKLEEWDPLKASSVINSTLHLIGRNPRSHRWDDFESAMVYDRDGTLTRVLLMSQIPEYRQRAGFCLIQRTKTTSRIPIEKLETYLNPDFVPSDSEK